MSSALTFFGGDIPEGSRATPGIFNRRFSALSQNIDELRNKIRSEVTRHAPTTSTSSGNPGEWAYDTSAIYVCVSDASWKRSTLAGF